MLNEDLKSLHNWANQWRVNFNANKTVYMLFSYKHNIPEYPSLSLGDTSIKLVDSHTHLGLTLDRKLDWKLHVSKTCTKASQRLSNIKRIRHLIPRGSAVTLYKTLVRPIMEYGDIIFDNASQVVKNELDKIQREALLMMTCAYRRTPTLDLYKEIGLETLHDRRKQHRLTLFFKMTNSLLPDYLTSLLPPPVGLQRKYRLRSETNSKLSVPYASTSKFANSYIIKTTKDWNELDISLRNSPSLNVFKQRIKVRKKTNSHGSHLTGRSVIHHTRIRLGLSPLRYHLYQFNIIDSPLCENCNIEMETTIHYFLHCPAYSHARTRLLCSLTEILPFDVLRNLQDECNLTDCILFGSDMLDNQTNRNIFECALHFISETKRFS